MSQKKKYITNLIFHLTLSFLIELFRLKKIAWIRWTLKLSCFPWGDLHSSIITLNCLTIKMTSAALDNSLLNEWFCNVFLNSSFRFQFSYETLMFTLILVNFVQCICFFSYLKFFFSYLTFVFSYILFVFSLSDKNFHPKFTTVSKLW